MDVILNLKKDKRGICDTVVKHLKMILFFLPYALVKLYHCQILALCGFLHLQYIQVIFSHQTLLFCTLQYPSLL